MKTKRKVERDPIAKDLRTPKYSLRVVKSKRVYNSKRTPKAAMDDLCGTMAQTEGRALVGLGGPMFVVKV